MVRYHQWVNRVLTGHLAVGDELWADLSDHPASARLEAIARRSGGSHDPGDIAYRIHRTLLLNVIHAAGGIEYTVGKLLAALEVVQRRLDEGPRPGSAERGSWLFPPQWDVSFEASNLMVWARMLRDRLMHETRDDEQVKVKVGLLPALNEQQGDLKKQVQRFRDQLDRWIRAEQELANYALHMGSLHGGMPAVRVEPNARARLRLPDPHPPGKRIWSWEEFTYHQDRDAATVATELLGRVERFMDGLLDSFEQHVPERFGPRR